VRRLIWTFFSKEKGIGGGGARVISSTGRERWGGIVFCAAIVCGDQSDTSKEEYVIRRHLANMATDLTLENTRLSLVRARYCARAKSSTPLEVFIFLEK
jgi:hypothetical protein